MKKYFMLLISVSVLIATVVVPFQLLSVAKDESVPASAEAEYPENIETEYITVKEYNGKIGLFKSGEETPYDVIEVYTFTLPDYDKTILKTGFEIERENIESVIQDYTG